VAVQAGELIVADDDGVAVLSEAEARHHLAACVAREADEGRRREMHRHRDALGGER
jgi:regulator of RNase E activity RraA